MGTITIHVKPARKSRYLRDRYGLAEVPTLDPIPDNASQAA